MGHFERYQHERNASQCKIFQQDISIRQGSAATSSGQGIFSGICIQFKFVRKAIMDQSVLRLPTHSECGLRGATFNAAIEECLQEAGDDCANLTEFSVVFGMPNWDTRVVKNMNGASERTTFNADLSKWNTAQVTDKYAGCL